MAVDEKQFYLRAVRRLLDRYSEIIGDAALGIAEGCAVISMEEGEIASVDDGAEGLSRFVAAYEEVIGKVAVRIARGTLVEMEKPDDVELPARLRPDGA